MLLDHQRSKLDALSRLNEIHQRDRAVNSQLERESRHLNWRFGCNAKRCRVRYLA